MRFRPLEIVGHFKAPPEGQVMFDGKAYAARTGEPIAVSLLAHGVRVLGRSSKYHRPRGLFCGGGGCGSCVAQLDGLPNQRLCLATVQKQGHHVEAQNVVGSARFDLLSTVDWLFSDGLDHHHMLTEPLALNRVAINMARKLAGLGKLPKATARHPQPFELCSADVVVVGGGEAGTSAAKVTRAAGLTTLVFDPHAPDADIAAWVLGYYDDCELVAAFDNTLIRLRPRAVVLATGGWEQPPPCPGNDLPGVLSLRAAEQALHYGVLPGKSVAVALEPNANDTLLDKAVSLATRLQDSGAEVPVWCGPEAQVPTAALHPGPLKTIDGSKHVRRVRLESGEAYRCDAVVWCSRPTPAYELARQMGAAVRYENEVGAFVPELTPEGKSSRAGLYIAGIAAGIPQAQAAAHGTRVGHAVVGYLETSTHSAAQETCP